MACPAPSLKLLVVWKSVVSLSGVKVAVSARAKTQTIASTDQNPASLNIFFSDMPSGSLQERAGKPLDEMTNLIPHPPIMSQGLLRACCIPGQFRRIIKSYMNDLRFSREYRAVFIGVPADS